MNKYQARVYLSEGTIISVDYTDCKIKTISGHPQYAFYDSNDDLLAMFSLEAINGVLFNERN